LQHFSLGHFTLQHFTLTHFSLQHFTLPQVGAQAGAQGAGAHLAISQAGAQHPPLNRLAWAALTANSIAAPAKTASSTRRFIGDTPC
jgi:hypothetical protein